MFRFIMAAFAAIFVTSAAAEEVHHSNLYRFEDFPAKVEQFRKAPIRLVRGTLAHDFRTTIKRAYTQDSVEFGGRYVVATAGCGTECQINFMIDTKSGRVFEVPGSSSGIDMKVDSNLLIVNPFWDSYYQDPRLTAVEAVTRYYLWNGKDFVLLQEEEWQYPDGTTTTGLVRDSWKAVAYNQKGDAYVSSGYGSPHEALLAAEKSCEDMYGGCDSGVFVPVEWDIHVGICQKPFMYVSLGVSPDGLDFQADVRLQALNSQEISSCDSRQPLAINDVTGAVRTLPDAAPAPKARPLG